MQVKDQSESPVSARRRLIIEAAVACFISNGFHQTGIRDIARKANVSLGNLYNHFSGKDAVLAEIAALEADELKPFEEIVANRTEPMDALLHFADRFLDYSARQENALMGLEVISEAVRNPEIAQTFAANRKNLVAALSSLLEQGSGAGVFRRFEDIEEAAKLILDLIEGQAFRSILANTSIGAAKRDELLEMIKRAVVA